MELIGDVDSMKVRLVGLREVNDVALGLGKANTDVESVNLNNENRKRMLVTVQYVSQK